MKNGRTLPLWYACLSKNYNEIGNFQPNKHENTVKFGPLTVFNIDNSCENSNFGPNQQSLVIFDGFLFDKKQLRKELGITNDNQTNSAIVAKAYEKWGQKLFDKLIGEYLLVIWDSHQGTFFIANDYNVEWF